MATQTIKIGDTVTIKETNISRTVSNISNGVYELKGLKKTFWSHELIAGKTKPQQKKHQQINQVSPQQKTLNAIYSILSKEYMQHNKTCIAKFPCCTGRAQEIHHRYLRTGFWLIMTNFFLPICRKCHRYATKNSKEAIDKGVSISRLSDPEYSFTDIERELMAKFGISPPN